MHNFNCKLITKTIKSTNSNISKILKVKAKQNGGGSVWVPLTKTNLKLI